MDFKWIADHVWAAFVALLAAAWALLQSSIKGQGDGAAKALTAHALEDERQFKAVHEELQTQRGHIGRIFEQMREEAQRANDRHAELLTTIHTSRDRSRG